MEFTFLTQQTMGLLLPFVYQVDRYFGNSTGMCNTNEITTGAKLAGVRGKGEGEGPPLTNFEN